MVTGNGGQSATDKPKKKRAAAKARVVYVVGEGLPTSLTIVTKADDLLASMDAAMAAGQKLEYRKVTLEPARKAVQA